MEEKKTSTGFTFSVNTIPGTSLLTSNDDRGSKNLLKTDNEIHSSMIAVLGNDDLFSEILLRLPVLSLHLFKSVCKHWLSLITSPNFTLSRQKIPKIDPPAGLLILRDTFEEGMCQTGYNFESFDIRIPSKGSIVFTASSDAPPGFVRVLHSCNGLLLCRIEPDMLCVCNPTIKLCKVLHTCNYMSYAKIVFDPAKSPHYKVILAELVHDDDDNEDEDEDDDDDDDDGDDVDEDESGYRQIEIYSSETGNWSLFGDRFPDDYFYKFRYTIYWNDALHWLITHDVCLHCNLKIVNEQPVLTKTELPRTFEGKLLESGGSLFLVSRDETDSWKLNVFEMKKGCSEWSVKYIVNLNDIMMTISNEWGIERHIWAIVSGEREEDSFMIIDSLSKVVQYNPMLKTLRTLYDLESTRSSAIFTDYEVYEFIPSFAGV